MISIKDYVKQVLHDIREVQEEEEKYVAGIRGVIDFDIATIANESGGAGLKVGVLGLGGEMGGKINNEITSRVKFSIQTRGAIAPNER